MSNNFFEKPFDEGTISKLNLFNNYLYEWLPVFVQKAYPKKIKIFDFFAGAGSDSIGQKGSPLKIINAVITQIPAIIEKKLEVTIYLNEFNKKHYERLKMTIEEMKLEKKPFKIIIENKDFNLIYNEWRPLMNDSANLIWLDQFGVKFINEKIFSQLVNTPLTDILFFISSNIFKRFTEEDSIYEILKISKEEIQDLPHHHIHRFVAEKYKSIAQKQFNSYQIGSFSIQKGKSQNIYGLIFGSRHLLGMEKFLTTCWNQDQETGEANFDIDDDKINRAAPKLFEEMDKPKKLSLFENELESEILKGNLKNENEIYIFSITKGFLVRHIQPVIKKLIEQKKIEKDRFGFTYGTLSDSSRAIKNIKLIK